MLKIVLCLILLVSRVWLVLNGKTIVTRAIWDRHIDVNESFAFLDLNSLFHDHRGSRRIKVGPLRGRFNLLQEDVKKHWTLAVTCPWVQQIRDDTGKAEFVRFQIFKDIELVREMPVQFAFECSRRLQLRIQLGEETCNFPFVAFSRLF